MISFDTLERSRRFLAHLAAAALATVIVVAVLSSQRTSDDDGNSPVPIKPFAQAREGDWVAYLVTTTEDGRPGEPEVFVSRVISVGEGRIVTRLEVRHGPGPGIEGTTRELPSKRPPTVAELFGTSGNTPALENVRFARAQRTFEGRRFECVHVEYDRRLPAPLVHVSAWVSDALPAGGVVAVNATGTDEKGHTTSVAWELAGFGSGSTAMLGATPEELARRSTTAAR
jgi:hypothetical protein